MYEYLQNLPPSPWVTDNVLVASIVTLYSSLNRLDSTRLDTLAPKRTLSSFITVYDGTNLLSPLDHTQDTTRVPVRGPNPAI